MLVAGLAGVIGGPASTVLAQDSTSVHAGLPGDAPDAYTLAEQCSDYVLDLAGITSSWGHPYAVGPLVKLTRTDPAAFFSNLPASSGVSATYAQTTFDATSYAQWNAPTQGVSATDNALASGSVTPTGAAVQFAAIVADFAPVGTVQTGHVTGAVVRIDPNEPNRLYVQRRIAATNGTDNTESSSSLSVGSVNEAGQAVIRADAFGAIGPNLISGNNLFVVDLLARTCGSLNVLTDSGGSDAAATSDIVRNRTTLLSPASILPASVNTATVFAADFAGDLLFGDAGSTATTSDHLAASAPLTTTDHRGTTSLSPVVWFAGSAGTGAVLASQEVTGPMDAETYGISYWGVNASDGGVIPNAAQTILFPAAEPLGPAASIVDHFDNHEIGNNAEPNSDWTFDHIRSQTPFRGGNGQVGLNTDAQGRLILAAHAAFGSFATLGAGQDSPVNAMIVARVDPAAPTTPEWTLAAWVDNAAPNGGKAITDGNGTTLGYLEQLDLSNGGDPVGPSMTSPAVDSAGNVWFVASARIIDAGAPGGFTHDTALIRAVYHPTTFAYELEAVLSVSDVIHGLNSDRDYQITALELADRNSVAVGAITSGSIIQSPWLDGPATSAVGDPAALGGLVFAASIVYDTNNDGQFVSPTGINGTPSSPDEEYQALMFLGVGDTTAPPCPGDFADDFGTPGSDGQVSFGDFLALLGLVGPCPGGMPGCPGDIADDFGTPGGDGQVSFGDFLALLGMVGPCP